MVHGHMGFHWKRSVSRRRKWEEQYSKLYISSTVCDMRKGFIPKIIPGGSTVMCQWETGDRNHEKDTHWSLRTSHEWSHACQEDFKAGLLLDHNEHRLFRVRKKIPPLSDSCEPYPCSMKSTVQNDYPMAIFSTENWHYWESNAKNFKWAWVYSSHYWLFHQVGRSSLLFHVEISSHRQVH